MVKKFLGMVLFTAATLSFTASASEESDSEVFGSDDEGVEAASMMVEEKVDNPIPALVTRVSGEGGLLNLDLGASFQAIILSLKDKCNVQLDKFGPDFSEHKVDWENKLALLENCATALGNAKTNYANASEQVAELHEELVLVTNNGFFSKIKYAIADTEHEACSPLLDETMQCFWQARELLEWIIATNELTVSVSALPELCSYVASGANVISKVVSTASDSAQKTSMFFWEVTDGYGCYDHGRAVNDTKHRQKVEKVLGDFKQKGSMLKPFDVETAG
jgi:hypothetical protein